MARFTEPGAILGIIGGGVEAYRLVLAAHRLGLQVVVLSPLPGDIAMQAADMALVGTSSDEAALQQLADRTTLITYLDENVDGEALATVTAPDQLPSGVGILDVVQDRYLEKVFFEDLNLNILPYAQVVTANDIAKAVEVVGFPAILKPIQKSVGQDQQLRLDTAADVARAGQLLQQRPYVLEAWLDEPQDFTVMVAKAGDSVQVMPLVETKFAGHQLQAAIVPASGGMPVAKEVTRIAQVIADKLDYTGVFAIAFYLTANGTLYVKRLYSAPQLNGAVLPAATGATPEEVHLRALLGWPLPNMTRRQPAVTLFLHDTDRSAALTQLQIKPEWRFRFYPLNHALLGDVTIIGDRAVVAQQLSATGYFSL